MGFIIASTIINVLAFVSGATFLPGGSGAYPPLSGGVLVCIAAVVGLVHSHASASSEHMPPYLVVRAFTMLRVC